MKYIILYSLCIVNVRNRKCLLENVNNIISNIEDIIVINIETKKYDELEIADH